jgi:hypothetical protein
LKECPDLTKFSAQEKQEFWKSNDPRSLRSVGDRLLAESLPHVESSRPREEISLDVVRGVESLGWNLSELSESLGVTEEMLIAWGEDRVKPPECLPFVLSRLRELSLASSE